MLLGCNAGKRLEPVCEMCGSLFNGPFLHGFCYGICYRKIKSGFLVDGFAKLLIYIRGKTCLHNLVIKHHTSEII